ncbi:MAG: hypothetical protein ACK4TA_21275 [Saprospiraceae bacterium]
MGKRTSGRVKRPSNPKGTFDLALAIYEKHVADGASSPLHSLTDIDWKDIAAKAKKGVKHHEQAEEHKHKMEENYRDRDNLADVVEDANNAAKALLKAVHPQNPKKLADWGYQVDDSTPPKKKT